MPIVRAALHGPIDASNLYVTYSKLHELLAQAFERSGQRDSAATHYRWVAAAWRNAEPPLRIRAEAVRLRLAAFEAGKTN